MSGLDLGAAMGAALAVHGSIPDILFRIAAPLGVTDLVVYLVDFAQTTLEPIPDRDPRTHH